MNSMIFLPLIAAAILHVVLIELSHSYRKYWRRKVRKWEANIRIERHM